MKGLSVVRQWLMVILLAAGAGAAAATAEDGLTPASGCAPLKHYLVNTAQQGAKLLLRYGAVSSPLVRANGGWGALPVEGDMSLGNAAASPPSDHSETNVQEAGVDEADLVKTDGDYIYLLNGNRFLILRSWPPAATAELSRVDLKGSPMGLFVQGDTAVAVSSVWSYPTRSAAGFIPVTNNLTRVTLFDITDRSAPKVVREIDLEGWYNTARLVDGYMHLVIGSYLPVYDFPVTTPVLAMPGLAEVDAQGLNERVAVRRYAKRLSRMKLDQLVPRYEDRRPEGAGLVSRVAPISECADFYVPEQPNGTSTISVVTLNLADPLGELQTASVVGDNGEVYASADNLYVVAINAGAWYWLDATKTGAHDKSVIHKFKLGAAPQYVASGEVDGWIVNRYALSEVLYDGQEVLRIATTENMWAWQGQGEGPRNRLFTLTQSGDRLNVLATLEGLGHEGERIYAVRYDGDRGYMVTFRQTDPLYTLDLADPAAPKVVGELKIPGFSTYLHPFGDGYLLAIGQNTDQGGADISLFDVRNPAVPTLVDREWLGENSWSEAMYEPKAFTYFEPLRQLALPVQQQWWWEGSTAEDGAPERKPFSGTLVFDVNTATGLSKLGEVDHADFVSADGWYWPQVQRNLYIGDSSGYALYSLSELGLKVNDASNFRELARVKLPGYDGPLYSCGDCVIEPLPVR